MGKLRELEEIELLDSNKKFGRLGENIAIKYLIGLNYEIIERNFRCKYGEIDIITRDKEEIVFIEVKTRKNLDFGVPSEAVDALKISHIIRTSKFFLCKKNIIDAFIRFDVIEVYLKNKKWFIRQIKNVY